MPWRCCGRRLGRSEPEVGFTSSPEALPAKALSTWSLGNSSRILDDRARPHPADPGTSTPFVGLGGINAVGVPLMLTSILVPRCGYQSSTVSNQDWASLCVRDRLYFPDASIHAAADNDVILLLAAGLKTTEHDASAGVSDFSRV